MISGDPPIPKKKLNKKIRSFADNIRDSYWTVSGCVIASLLEATAVHLWALGLSEYYTDATAFPMLTTAHMAFSFFWADFHFYWAHRVLHPWRIHVGAGCNMS